MPELYSLQDDQRLNEFDACYAQRGAQDYRVEDHFYGGAELKGARHTQEDRMIAWTLGQASTDAYQRLSTPERHEVILDAFKSVSENVLDNDRRARQGSTAMVAWYDPTTKEITTASLGDAVAFAVICNPQTQTFRVQKLNHEHNPGQEAEKQRLMEFARLHEKEFEDIASANPFDPTQSLRLGGTLAVSRAFGDVNYHEYGLSDIPQVETNQFNVQQGEQLFLVTACDGLTERDLMSAENIGQLVLEHNQQTPGKIAQLLAEQAFQKGSRDNISVQVAQCPTQSNVSPSPFALAIFDGHGGDEVSQYLKKNFKNGFTRALAKVDEAVLEDIDNINSTPSTPILDLDDLIAEPGVNADRLTNRLNDLIQSQQVQSPIRPSNQTANQSPKVRLSYFWPLLISSMILAASTALGVFSGYALMAATLSAVVPASVCCMLLLGFEHFKAGYKQSLLRRYAPVGTPSEIRESFESTLQPDFEFGQKSGKSGIHGLTSVVYPRLWFNAKHRQAYYLGQAVSEIEQDNTRQASTPRPRN